MAKKAAKKTSKKTAKKAGKKTTKKTGKKTTQKTAAKSEAGTGNKSGKTAAVKKKKSAERSGGKKISSDVNEEKINTVTDKAKKTTKKTRVKAPRKKGATSNAAPAAPVPEIRRGLKLAPGVLLTGLKKTEAKPAKECEPTEYRKLTKKETQQIKEKLIEMREDILDGVRKELADSKQRASSAPADIIDQAADAYDDDVSFEIAAASDEELEQIEAALERLEEGSYGQCEACSATISPTRLKILPFATRCVSCRGDYEKTKRRRDSGVRNFFGEGELDEDTGNN